MSIQSFDRLTAAHPAGILDVPTARPERVVVARNETAPSHRMMARGNL